jgi:ABC-type histidine transport system ATPase subunit
MLPLGALGFTRRQARERALVALVEVGLSARSQLRPAEMSGGASGAGMSKM